MSVQCQTQKPSKNCNVGLHSPKTKNNKNNNDDNIIDRKYDKRNAINRGCGLELKSKGKVCHTPTGV